MEPTDTTMTEDPYPSILGLFEEEDILVLWKALPPMDIWNDLGPLKPRTPLPVERDADWLKWVTTQEAIALLYLAWRARIPSGRHEARRRIVEIRGRAIKRRARNNQDFAVYQKAM